MAPSTKDDQPSDSDNKTDNNAAENKGGEQGSSNSKDFVIRDGFPALYLPNGGGPWIKGDEPIPRHNFWAHERALHFSLRYLEDLWDDCVAVFSARARESDQAYSTGTTYFCPCRMKPRCALEALVLSIFWKHCGDLDERVFVAEQSGAEWWTLVLDDDNDDGNDACNNNENKEEKEQKAKKRKTVCDSTAHDEDDGDEEEEGDEVGFHFDADYGLEDQVPNLMLHPRLGTVTYLTDFGAPTVVLDQRSPPPSDVEKRSLQGCIRKGWLSSPKIGKHMAFDGRLLHGAPGTYFPAANNDCSTAMNSLPEPISKKSKQDRKRITLLVNIWLNHCPLDAELLEGDVCDGLKTPWRHSEDAKEDNPFRWDDSVDLSTRTEMKNVSLAPSESDPAGEEEVVICNRMITISFGAAREDFCKATAAGGVVELDLDRGVLSLEVGDEVQYDEEGNDDDEQDNN